MASSPESSKITFLALALSAGVLSLVVFYTLGQNTDQPSHDSVNAPSPAGETGFHTASGEPEAAFPAGKETAVVGAAHFFVQPAQIAFQPPPADMLANLPSHPAADSLGTDNLSAVAELDAVLELFAVYHEYFKALPTGEENYQFMNALRGANPQRLPIFPYQHSRLDSAGNLVDAHGTPFFFHRISRSQIEVRSAGPDLEFYTSDDTVTSLVPAEATH